MATAAKLRFVATTSPSNHQRPRAAFSAQGYSQTVQGPKLSSLNSCRSTIDTASFCYLAKSRTTRHSSCKSRFISQRGVRAEIWKNEIQEEQQPFKVIFVEMGVGYDQHGQDITKAAIKACNDAITSNSIPAFRTGGIPGVTYKQMKLKIILGVPAPLHDSVDVDKVTAIFPYGDIVDVDIRDGGLICSSGVALEAMGDKNDDCYVVNAAVYVGY